jgi:hypothetical protein
MPLDITARQPILASLVFRRAPGLVIIPSGPAAQQNGQAHENRGAARSQIER